MLLAALLQALVAAMTLGLPLYAVLRLLWLRLRAAVASAIDLCFTLKGSLDDRR